MNPTYNDILELVRPFFLDRGWDTFATNDRMMQYLCLAIQDVFNKNDAIFTHKVEEWIVWVVDGNKMKFTTLFPIRKVDELVDQNWTLMVPTLYILHDYNYDQFKFEWNVIITNTNVEKISVAYIMDYTMVKYATHKDTPIPVPSRYVWAIVKLMYDWAAPINLMGWDATAYDFFAHAMNRLDQLSSEDALTNTPRLNPAY